MKTSAVLVAATMTVTLGLAPLSTSATTARAAPSTTSCAHRSSATAAADWVAATYTTDRSAWNGGSLAQGIIALVGAGGHDKDVAELDTAMATAYPTYAKGGPGSIAYVLVAVESQGQDPTSWHDHDLVAELRSALAKSPDGGGFFGPGLSVIALSRAGATVPGTVLDALLKTQGSNGAFGYYDFSDPTKFTADPDYTALAIAALDSLSSPSSAASAALDKAIAWAESSQTKDHYWANYSPVNSTGMMIPALAQAGVDVSASQAWLASELKRSGGKAFAASPDSTEPNLMATTQGLWGLTGFGLTNTTPAKVRAAASACSSSPTPSTSASPTTPSPTSSSTQPSSTSPAATLPGATSTSSTRPVRLPSTGDDSSVAGLAGLAVLSWVPAILVAARRRK
ncbi:hypothetical protein [Acidipropionibacterium timonense]|uniref:hypothetical protein n=1 Tax=Acidipropionibacterium timonense TaxID=2161818 RepID=UPI0010308D2A|nr:hypothetical protein [Acidipropionibacterium timonense]